MTLERPNSLTVKTVSPADAARRILRECPYYAIRLLQCSYINGILIIGGRVPSYYFKQLAQAYVQQIPGVNQISNRIEVSV